MASPTGIGTAWRLTSPSEIGILARDPETFNQMLIVGFANSYEAVAYINSHQPWLTRAPIVHMGAKITEGILQIDVSCL